jgi:DNA polymerase-3 subunit delta'
MSMSWEQLEQYQPNALKMIANSIQKGRVAHAYLFEGQRGTGKKEASLLFAKSLFCLNRSTYKPCYECINCRRIDSGNHPDVHMVAPDGQSIKKHQIERLQEEFTKTAMESNKKLYIIEHADQMTTNAANSLLKFLEDPSSETIAILLTEQLHRMLNTIISRCQMISFKPLPPRVLIAYLEEQGIPRHIATLAAHITNSRQEALELSQSDWFAQARKIVLQLYEALNKSYVQALFVIQDKWLHHFTDKEQMNVGLDLLLYLYKDLLYIQTDKEEQVIYHDQIDEFKRLSFIYSQKRVIESMSAILRAKARLNTNMNPQLLMEQLALQLREGSTFV